MSLMVVPEKDVVVYLADVESVRSGASHPHNRKRRAEERHWCTLIDHLQLRTELVLPWRRISRNNRLSLRFAQAGKASRLVGARALRLRNVGHEVDEAEVETGRRENVALQFEADRLSLCVLRPIGGQFKRNSWLAPHQYKAEEEEG